MMAKYLHVYHEHMAEFVTHLDDKEAPAKYVQDLICAYNEKEDELKHELKFVVDTCDQTVSLLKFFQTNSTNAANVYNILADYRAMLATGGDKVFRM